MDRLAVALWEAQRHADALRPALASWQHATPDDLASVESDPGQMRLLDQIVYRFIRLQDCLGERLVPATLDVLAEPHRDWPMRDRLERLERLGYLNVDDWLQWRDLRNRLTHEYPESPDLRWAGIRAAIEAAGKTLDLFEAWRKRLPG